MEHPNTLEVVDNLMDPTKTIDVLSFGIAAVDDILNLQNYPESGCKMPISSVQRHNGGQSMTALVAAARLGLRCVYAGILGKNELSLTIRRGLEEEGIRFAGSKRHLQARPYHSYILVDCPSGERTILYSGEGVCGPDPGDIDDELIAASRVLLVDQAGPSGTLHACRLARSSGVPIVADLERMDCKALRQVMELAGHLIMSARMAQEITGRQDHLEALPMLAGTERTCTAITDGAEGCWFVDHCRDGFQIQHQEAFKVDVKDTTGCGDVFHGAYAAGLAWGFDIPRSIRLAAASAALKATGTGGQDGIPDRQTVEEFLKGTN